MRAQRRAPAGPCWPAGILCVRRAAALPSSTAAAEETAITLRRRSTVCPSAAASVSHRPNDRQRQGWENKPMHR